MRHTLIVIAGRNVMRNRRRTLITAVVLTAGIAAFIFFDSLLAGMDRMTLDSMMDMTTSALVARTPGYEAAISGTPLDYGIPEPEKALATLRASVPALLAVAPRTKFIATVSNYTDDVPVAAVAVDIEADTKVFTLSKHLASGTWFGDPDGREVVMGAGLAGELGLAAGDYVLISARTIYDTVNADEYRIAGLLDSSAPEIGNSGLFMGYGAARELLGTPLPVTEIASSIARGGRTDALIARADKAATASATALPGLTFTPIGKLAGDYLAMRNMKAKYSFMIILVVLAIAAVGIINTVLMSVYSRIREIGILRAYGMERSQIRRLFALEGVIVGLVGSLGGVIVGALAVWYGSSVGLDLSSMMGKLDLGSIPMGGILRGEWKPESMLIGFIFGVATSWLAALVPARKAARMEAIDALRFV